MPLSRSSPTMHHPDEIDVRIIKEFSSPRSPQWNVRESYAKVAVRVGVDEETVRKRIIRMRQTGTFPRWLMKPNPHLLGRHAAAVDLEVEGEKKSRAISKISELEGVVTILDFLGKGIMMALYYADDADLARTVEKIVSICGAKPVVCRAEFPRAEVAMKKLDWKIISVMADDARMDLEQVAKLTGVSLRVVERHLAKMTEGRSIYLSGQPDYRRMAGIVCNFLVFCPETIKKQAMDREVLIQSVRIERSDTTSKEYSMFVIDCENPRKADDTLAWLKSFDGAKWVRIGIMKEIIHVQTWLKARLENGHLLDANCRPAQPDIIAI